MEGKISMQEQIPELDKRAEEEEEEEDYDDDIDGPPPGFQCIPIKIEVDEEEDDGPPPGFHSSDPKPSPAPHSSDEDSKQDVEDDDDGPPPGWEFFSMANALPKQSSISADANVENNAELNEDESESEIESDHEGPPPGWEKVLPHKMASSCSPPLQPSQAVSAEAESKGKTKDENKRLTSVPAASSKQSVPAEAVGKGDTKDVDKRPTSVPAASPKHSVPSTSHPSQANAGLSSSEKAQLVCGTCQKLMVYPRGAKRIQCPGCQEVNFVLEANEVGQVKCGNCAILLMFQFGAPAVICTSCNFITEIGANNRLPPLSVQIAQKRRRAFRGRAR